MSLTESQPAPGAPPAHIQPHHADHTDHHVEPDGPRKSWAVLAVALTAQILVVLDISVVNTALPSIGAALKLRSGDLQWLVTAYLMMSGGGLLLGGRIADLLSRRRVFLTGLTAFTGASLLSGFASNATELIAARAGQGLSAALMTPAALSLIMTTYSGAQRRKGLARHLLGHTSPRNLAVAGLAITAGAAMLLSTATGHAHYATDLLPGLVLLGLGVGMVFVPVSVTATAGIPRQHAGMASGFLMTGHEVGAALGVAVLSAVATTAGSLTSPAGIVAGFSRGFTAAAVIAGLIAVVALVRMSATPVAAGGGGMHGH